MNRRLFLALLFLVVAFGIQFMLASSDIFVNVILATLVAFASFFDIGEMVVFILLALFVVNWQPALSPEIALFGALPLVAFGIRKISSWQGWAFNLTAVFLAILATYLVIAPGIIIRDPGACAEDLIFSMLFGQLVFSLLLYYGQ